MEQWDAKIREKVKGGSYQKSEISRSSWLFVIQYLILAIKKKEQLPWYCGIVVLPQ